VVIAELALTVMLLIGAGLLLRSFHRLRSLDLGFHPQVLTMHVDLPRHCRGSGADTSHGEHALRSFRDRPDGVCRGRSGSCLRRGRRGVRSGAPGGAPPSRGGLAV